VIWGRSSFDMVHIWSQSLGGRVNFFLHVRDSRRPEEGTAVGRFLKRMFKLSLLAAAAYAVWRWFEAQRSESDLRWEAQPAPYPPRPRVENSPPATPVTATPPATPSAPEAAPAAAAPAAAGDAWVEPVDGVCPTSHPVKAKMSSRIYHVEGGLNYGRVHPDRCYRDPAAAEADGLRRAAR
jgi:hypothetical protein